MYSVPIDPWHYTKGIHPDVKKGHNNCDDIGRGFPSSRDGSNKRSYFLNLFLNALVGFPRRYREDVGLFLSK